jgi:hypothetical protein
MLGATAPNSSRSTYIPSLHMHNHMQQPVCQSAWLIQLHNSYTLMIHLHSGQKYDSCTSAPTLYTMHPMLGRYSLHPTLERARRGHHSHSSKVSHPCCC